MNKKYTVQHLGFPTTRRIEENEWKNRSTHASNKAAFRAIDKAQSHLDSGSWDDHYRVIAPDGSVCQREFNY